MTSCTDPLHLNDKRLFKELKKSLSDGGKETRNILEIRDNVLYVWNAEKYCVLTLNVAATRGKFGEDVPYQTLQPTDPPIFDVTNVLINETATQLALWGNLGIVLLELPKRWGKDAVFHGGKEVIICTSHNFGNFGATTDILKVRWHPGSPNDSHLLVLTSENSFCLYECAIGDTPKLIRSWKVGRTPSSSPSKIPSFASLGDTAVDFDFATPTLRKSDVFAKRSINEISNAVNWNQIEWPILVLRGNGEVLIVRGNVLRENNENPVVLGSLSMYPLADDNYGIDSCSIMCVQTTPPIVVIATCTGKIYHAILLKEVLDDEDDDKKTWSQYGSNYSLHTPEDALYVYEIVEMDLGLLLMEDDKYSCPIHLHSDKGNKSRYFCSHNAGIHMISLPMVSQLDEYVNTGSDDAENVDLPSLSNQSSSQYLVCTRTKHTGVEEATPILGFGLLQEPCFLIALLYTGVVVDISVIDIHYLPRIEPPDEPTLNKSKKVNKEPFDVYIQNMLKHEASQPVTKLGSRRTSSKECLELLYRATHIFRTQHFDRHDKVREEISKKVCALKALKTHLLKELNTLMETKKELHQTAERLAERYEDIKDKQEKLARRAEEVLRLVNYKEPSMTAIERAEAEELKKMDTKVRSLRIRLEQLRKKSEQQNIHLENYECSEKKREIILSNIQEEAIKDNLGQMAKDIKYLIKQVKRLEEEINI